MRTNPSLSVRISKSSSTARIRSGSPILSRYCVRPSGLRRGPVTISVNPSMYPSCPSDRCRTLVPSGILIQDLPVTACPCFLSLMMRGPPHGDGERGHTNHGRSPRIRAVAVSTLPSLARSFRRHQRVSDGLQGTCWVVWQLGRKNGGNYKIDRAVLERKNRRARDRIVTVAHTTI